MEEKDLSDDFAKAARKIMDMFPPEQQVRNVKGLATQMAYKALNTVNQAQQKVTEEELRQRATSAAVASEIVKNSLVYGEPEASMKIFIQVFIQVWHEGGAVVSALEHVAILAAQADKHKDSKKKSAPPDSTLFAKAQAAAMGQIAGEKLASTTLSSKVPTLLPPTEEQQAEIKNYIEAYIKAYRAYDPSRKRKFLGLL